MTQPCSFRMLLGAAHALLGLPLDQSSCQFWHTCRVVSESPQVERLIHFSELGAEEGHPSRRLASKAKGDRLLSELVPSATIVR